MSDGNIIAGQATELEFVLVNADTGAPITSDDHDWIDIGGGVTDELVVFASDGAGGHESIAVEIANLKEISKAALPGRWAFAATLAHPGLASWRTNVTGADNDGLGSRSARIVAAPPPASAIADEVETRLASILGLLHENSVVDQHSFDSTKPSLLLSCRVRRFASSAAASAATTNAAAGADGETHRWTITASYNTEGVLTRYQLVGGAV